MDEAAKLIERFDQEDDDDPFAYNETASVSLLCAAAARIGCLALAEFTVKKRHQKDGRRRSNGRVDFWMRCNERVWSFEFKQITYGTVTMNRLSDRMSAADQCARKLLRYGPEHMISGLIVPLYYLDKAERAQARERLNLFARECDFAWHLSAPHEGPETFLLFNEVSRPAR